jgi:predicted DNA-binding WGR domain protein
MEKLLQFVASAVPTLPTLGDFIQVALHCLRPEKNEDKVYLVTVHPGTTASTCHVTAHWGARSAKRLSSQMKAINVSKAVAATEVEKAKQEKLKGGYLPAAYAKLLTDEARSHLSASLGLFEAEQAPNAKGKGQPKEKPVPSKVKLDKVVETKLVTKLMQSNIVEIKPVVKVESKPDKKQKPAVVEIAKKKTSKEAAKPVLTKKPAVVAKLPEKKSAAKKVVAVSEKQAAKVLPVVVKMLPPKVAVSTPQKTTAKKATKEVLPAPLKSASKKAVKTATTPTATVKTPSRRR